MKLNLQNGGDRRIYTRSNRLIRFERKKEKIGNLFFSEMNRVNLNITAFPVDIGKPGLSVSEIM